MNTFDFWNETGIEPSPDECGWVHKDDIPNIASCEDMLEGVIEALYETGDVDHLEYCLDELVSQFGMKLPKNKPILEK